MDASISAALADPKKVAAIFAVVGALYVTSPKYVSVLWATDHGRLIAAIALGWMALGAAMMKKMVSFDI